MKKRLLSLILSVTMIGVIVPHFTAGETTAQADGAIPAFPGAEGAGKYATGGRGGTVVHVTNLNDSGAGSLRDAVSKKNRIVVFDVGGTINLKSDISCMDNITVAGQTAPGGKGVTLRNGKFAFGGNNIIVRFISSRPGEKGKGSGDYDAWGGSKGSNSIIDHCSIGWANDEQFGLYSATNQTVQYTIVGPSNCVSNHSKGEHGFGVMFGAENNSWHHNILAHSRSRNFRGKVSAGRPIEFVNNVIYDWGSQTAYGSMGKLNYVGNYLKMGPSTKGGQRFLNLNSGTHYDKCKFYMTGNKIMRPDGSVYSEAINNDNWNGGIDYGTHKNDADYYSASYIPISASNGMDVSMARNPESADDAFEHVVSYAGASINPDNSQDYDYKTDSTRTKIDAQVLYEARTGTGSLTGGREFSTVTDSTMLASIAKYGIQYCDYNSYYPEPVWQKEITDSDNDGMPDEWEDARGLNPTDAKDATGDYLNQGYTNIEYYINDLTVNAFPKGVVTVSPVLVDLGPEYQNAKKDVEAIKLSPTTIKEAENLTLPTVGENGSTITWSSSSSAIIISNNKITKVNRPNPSNENVTLTATVKNGEFTIRRGFTVTVLGLPTKFDFGEGTAQQGYAAVNASTLYSDKSSYGFTDNSQSPPNKSRAPSKFPEEYTNLYEDMLECGDESHFKAEMPNGKYTVLIHYGSWTETFGTSFTVEGVNSGNLFSTTAAQYLADVEVTDGALDVIIKKGGKPYGGYICGLEIFTDYPEPEYHFDFGGGEAQTGYAAVPAKTVYSVMRGYGFTKIPDGIADMERGPGNFPAGYENLYKDQIDMANAVRDPETKEITKIQEAQFRADIPNGKYLVTIHYGSSNKDFGANYTLQGVNSGNLSSLDASTFVKRVEVTDGALIVDIARSSKSWGGYISGMDIVPAAELPYHFDFGNGDAQDGYIAVAPSTVYDKERGYGFDQTVVEGMTRAPVEFPYGFDELYNDQILATEVNAPFTFKANVPNGKYKVTIHYGSINKDFSSIYSVEGTDSVSINSLEGTSYETETNVTDGVLDVVVKKGSKRWGGYINGMEVTQLEAYPESSATPTTPPTAPPTTPPTTPPTPPPDEPTGEIAVSIPQKPVSSGNTLTVNVDISNGTTKAVTADIIAAVYDEKGALKALMIKPAESISKGASSKSFSFSGNLSAKTVKVMLFDSLKNMKPFCPAAESTL